MLSSTIAMRRTIAISASAIVLASTMHAGEPRIDDEARQFLEFHNAARAEVGVEPLTWSSELSAFAQQWADHLAATGKFEHRPSEGEWAGRYGENIALWSMPEASLVDAAKQWYAEKKDYMPGTALPTDFAMFKAGHYTQMIWRGTKQVGVGRAVIQIGKFKGWTVVVANYDPPGNAQGEKPYEELMN